MKKSIFYRFKFFRILLYILFCLVLLEMTLRLISPDVLKLEKYPLIFKSDSIYGYSLIPNASSEFIGMEHKKPVHVNQNGFLGKNFQLQKDVNVYRIIILGECQLSGIYLNDNEKDVIQILEEKFQKDKYKIEVINCSIDGAYREPCITKFIKNEISKMNPDMIITEYLPQLHKVLASREIYRDYVITYQTKNDSARNKAIKVIDNIYHHWFLWSLYDYSYIVRGFMFSWRRCLDRTILQMNFDTWQSYETYRRKKMKDADAIRGYNDKFSIKESDEMYVDLKESLEKKGIKLVFISYANLERLQKSKAYADINLSKYTFLSPKVPLVFPNIYAHESHYSVIGHKKIADSIYNQLINKDLIPLKFKM